MVITSYFVAQKAFVIFQKLQRKTKTKNIAGRLPENSRNRFVDRQSEKNNKKDIPKNSSLH